MGTILKAENISKQYRLGQVGTGTLGHDMTRWWASLRGKEDPYLNVGAVNERSAMATEDYIWALRDINFEVKTGEVLGIIGKNGAGKSTLLKILSRVTSPTTGSIKTRGRMASLLEVGTGFHGELSGRENIFMNGAILGMTKNEIKSKLDEIIDFSGCEMFIDTPVKRYSSGMTVRLGFAVAAHLEPEILVVDEVLAVGDAEFQKKAVGKMQNLSKGEGRTVLFVSHNMGSIKHLCTSAIVLDKGKTVFEGSENDAVSHYLALDNQNITQYLKDRKDRLGNGKLLITGIEYLNENGEIINQVYSGEYLKIRINIQLKGLIDYSNLFVGVALKDKQHQKVVSFLSDEMGADLTVYKKLNYIDLIIPRLYLRAETYIITLQLNEGSTRATDFIDYIDNASELTVLPGDLWKSGRINRSGSFAVFPAYF